MTQNGVETQNSTEWDSGLKMEGISHPVTSRFANLISPNRVSPGLGGLVGYRPKQVSGLGLAG